MGVYTLIKPREYQLWANNQLWYDLHDKPKQNPLIVMPTGTGKSINIAMIIWYLINNYPTTRIMQLTHVKEVLKSNYDALMKLWPHAPAGIYSAGLDRKESHGAITFGGIMSVRKKAKLFGKIQFVIIDEAHLVSDNESAAYVKFIAELRKINPNLIVIGFTATPFRMGMGMLTDGKLFDYISYDLGSADAFVWLIEQGYLCAPIPSHPGFMLDSDDVKISAGDFKNNDASAAMHQQNIIERAVDETIRYGEAENRQAWLNFCQTIEDCDLVAEMFTAKGHPIEAVHSKRNDRDEVLKDFRNGNLRGVTSQGVLTTGYDQKNIDLIAMLRLTRSASLWVQMMGRGTRPLYEDGYDLTTQAGRLAAIAASPKQNCRVLDFVGNTERLGPINHPTLPRRRGKGGGDPIVRKCPECGTYHHPSVKVCTECGYEFPPPERIGKASTKELVELTRPLPEKEYEIYGVHELTCTHHEGKGGKNDTLKVSYRCGYKPFNEWLCFNHDSGTWPYRKACEWWKLHGGGEDYPVSVNEAIDRFATEITAPKFIKVHTNTKYPKPEAYDFKGTKFEINLVEDVIHEVEPDPLEGFVKNADGDIGYNIPYDEEDIPF